MTSFKEFVIDATTAMRDGDYDTAISIYEREMQENNKETYVVSIKGIALCYGWKGDLENAFEYADKVLTIEPYDSQMLILAARYWHDKQDEEMTYKYICKAIENPPTSEEKIPQFIFWILKPFSLFFKNLRNIEKKANNAFYESEQKDKEWIAWAVQYKNWYESKGV